MIIRGSYGLTFNVTIKTEEVVDDIDQLKKSVKDLEQPLEAIAAHMRASIKENFIRRGRPDSWPPIKPGTVAGRLWQGGKVRFSRLQLAAGNRLTSPLIDTGQLLASYATKGANHVEEISKNKVEVGSEDPLAAVHEHGTGLFGPKGQSYVIRPKRVKCLRFMGTNGPVFAKQIIHPGVQPRPVAVIQDDDIEFAITTLGEHIE